MTQVVPYRDGASVDVRASRDWIVMMAPAAELARAVASTEFVPRYLRNNPAAITAAILYGDEIGLGPMQSIAKVRIIEGTPSLAAETMRGLILAAGHEIWAEEKTNTHCTMAGRRAGSELIDRATWTIDDAKRANLNNKDNWRKYPRRMLIARATADLARDLFADVIGGMQATEEISEDFVTAAEPDTEPPPPARSSKRQRADKAPQSPPVVVEAPPPADPAPTATEHPSGQTGPTAPPLAAVPNVGAPGGADVARPDAAVPARPPLPGEEPQLITDPQMRLMHRLFNERGMRDRDERIEYTRALFGKPELQSSKELTVDEAARLIDQLQAGDPSETPPPSDEDEPI